MEKRFAKNRYTIGEFSKLSGVPKQTLQFYDKLNIFSPAYREDNGYRFYEAEQFESIDIIYSLKEAGLPLSDVKAYLETRTPENCMSLLERETDRIKEKIENLNKTLKHIEQKKSSTMRGLDAIVDNTIKFEQMPEAHLFTWDFSEVSDENFTVELFKMVNWCYDHGFYSGYAMGSILAEQALLSGKFTKIQYMFTIIDSPTTHENYRYRPAGLYAIYYYKGSYEKLPKIYDRLLSEITSSGYTVAGDSYESGLLDFFSVRDPESYLIEIAIPVRL